MVIFLICIYHIEKTCYNACVAILKKGMENEK